MSLSPHRGAIVRNQAPPRRNRPQQHERALQNAVVDFLHRALPPEAGVPWTCFPAGGGGKARGGQLKAMGLESGWPDLMLLGAGATDSGLYFGIELKAPKQKPSPAQVAVHAKIGAAGGKVAVCWSVVDVSAALEGWGFPLRYTAVPFGAGHRLMAVR